MAATRRTYRCLDMIRFGKLFHNVVFVSESLVSKSFVGHFSLDLASVKRAIFFELEVTRSDRKLQSEGCPHA